MPVSDPRILAALIVGMGALGLGDSWLVWRRMVNSGVAVSIDHDDPVCYFIAPAAGYAVLVSAGVAVQPVPNVAGDFLATADLLLLFAGLRNAWDITAWILLRGEN